MTLTTEQLYVSSVLYTGSVFEPLYQPDFTVTPSHEESHETKV